MIHGYGRSEGCVTAQREILDDIHKRLKDKENLKISISVEDKRNDMGKYLSPLPYK